jgi:OOP family OmpA-OmpF porin
MGVARAIVASMGLLMALINAARADDTSPTVPLGIGPHWLSGTSLNVGSTSGDSSADNGWATVGSVGLALDSNWRAEVEIGYRGNGSRSLPEDSGDASAWSGMGNVLYGKDIGSGWTPYIGAGFGALRYRTSGLRMSAGGPGTDDAVPAYQGILGVSYAVTPNSRFYFDYRYLRTDDLKVRDTAGNNARTNTMLLGWRFTLPQASR